MATKTFDVKLTKEQKKLTSEELLKDTKMRAAEAILQSLDNVVIKWEKGTGPRTRRVLVLRG